MSEEDAQKCKVNTYEELLTVNTEIECVLNSRPFTCVNSEDMDKPLTPSHLVTGRRFLSLPKKVLGHEEKDNEVVPLTRRQRYLISLFARFWTRWSREYVVELREHRQVKGHIPVMHQLSEKETS